jgi:hypothetical protein
VTTENSTVSWIAMTRGAVALAKDTNEANRQIADLEDARASLRTLLSEFRVLADGASVARTVGWAGWTPSPDIARDFSHAAKDLDPRPLNRLLTALNRASPEIRSGLVEAWGAHARSRLGDLEELLVLAQTLSDIEGVSDLSRRLRAALLSLAGTQGSIPSPASVERLTNADALLAELEESLQPDSVRQFLSSVAHGGASMDLLSEDVLAWLRSHNASGRFKIVAGSPMEKTSD